jgi:hypothetical protein
MPVVVIEIGKCIRAIPNHRELGVARRVENMNRMAHNLRKEAMRFANVPVHYSPVQEPMHSDSKFIHSSDPKCWKNQVHACKNWMRHLCRIHDIGVGGY